MKIEVTMDEMIVDAVRQHDNAVWEVTIKQTVDPSEPAVKTVQCSDEQMSALMALMVGEMEARPELNATLYSIAEPAVSSLGAHRPIP